jgi:hypothetical protein
MFGHPLVAHGAEIGGPGPERRPADSRRNRRDKYHACENQHAIAHVVLEFLEAINV